MAEISRLIALRDSLEADQSSTESLEALNTLLECAPSNTEILQVASIINPQLLFLYLVPNDRPLEVMDLVCAVLAKMLNAFPFAEWSKMSQQVELGLQHSYMGVRLLCVKLLVQKIMVDESFHEIILQPTMFHLITQLLGDENLECAKYSSNLLRYLVSKPPCLAIITAHFKVGFFLDLEGLMRKGDIVRFRVYELIVHLACISSEVFEFVQSTGNIDKLIGELESDDVLLKLNCLELLQTLTESHLGLTVVESADVMKKLHRLLTSANQDPFASVLVPGIIKFFGNFCQKEAVDYLVICSRYPQFLLTTLSAIFSPEDDTIWGVAVDTLALMGSSLNGRLALAQHPEETSNAIKKLGEFVTQSKPDLRIRALNAFILIFSCEEDSSQDSTSYNWFLLATPNLMAIILSIVKQPFLDMRYACLHVLMSMSKWKWGQSEMKKFPGFVEYLLDRRTETEKEGKELKYAIIQQLASSSTSEEIFGSPMYLKLKVYVSEGPFYVTEETTVAYEEM